MDEATAMKGLINLEEVIDQLRLELKNLQKKSEEDGQDLRFAVESAELEFQVLVKKEGKVNSKISFWVMEAGGEGSYSKEETQTVRLKLKPQQVDPKTGKPVGSVQVGRRRSG